MNDEAKLWIGGMIITNLATIGLVIGWIFKAGMFVKATELGIEKSQDTANRLHVRLSEHVKEYHSENN